MPGLELVSVSKRYPTGQRAVDRVSLAVDPGQLLVLVGPSGCGKTTMLRMIAGLEEVTAGEIRIGDRRVNELPPRQRDIAMVFQNYALYPHMTVRRTWRSASRSRQAPRAEIDAARARGRRPARARADCSTASRGSSRAASGSAWRSAGRSCAQPQVFLFDEPLSNLDAKLRVQMRAEIAGSIAGSRRR